VAAQQDNISSEMWLLVVKERDWLTGWDFGDGMCHVSAACRALERSTRLQWASQVYE
jgi:hypothetical protein